MIRRSFKWSFIVFIENMSDHLIFKAISLVVYKILSPLSNSTSDKIHRYFYRLPREIERWLSHTKFFDEFSLRPTRIFDQYLFKFPIDNFCLLFRTFFYNCSFFFMLEIRISIRKVRAWTFSPISLTPAAFLFSWDAKRDNRLRCCFSNDIDVTVV